MCTKFRIFIGFESPMSHQPKPLKTRRFQGFSNFYPPTFPPTFPPTLILWMSKRLLVRRDHRLNLCAVAHNVGVQILIYSHHSWHKLIVCAFGFGLINQTFDTCVSGSIERNMLRRHIFIPVSSGLVFFAQLVGHSDLITRLGDVAANIPADLFNHPHAVSPASSAAAAVTGRLRKLLLGAHGRFPHSRKLPPVGVV